MATGDRFYEGFKRGAASERGRLSTGDGGRAFWQNQVCPPWCTSRHSDGDAYEDRCHYGGDDVIILSCEDITGGGPRELKISLWSHYREQEPRVSFHKDDRIGVYLTLSEANHLATVVNRLVGEALPSDEPSELCNVGAGLKSVA